MWIGLFFLLVLSVAGYLLYSSRASTKSKPLSGNGLAGSTSWVLNPSGCKKIPSILAWEFVAPNLSTACQYAQNHHGVRRRAFECPALPLPDCGSHTCQCHYRPVMEERRRERRKTNDRRDEHRMKGVESRRKPHDRRKGQAEWHEKTIR